MEFELGFEISEASGKVVFEDEFSRVVLEKGGVLTYCPKKIPGLTSEDRFRIGKIIEAYQKLPEIVEAGEGRRGEISRLVSRYESALGKRLPNGKRELYEKIVFLSTGEGLMPISPLLEDPEIEEIMANGTSQPIFIYHRKLGMLRTSLRFTSGSYLVEKANQLLFPLGKRVDWSKPSAHSILSGGERISVEIPPVSKEPLLDIRKFSEKPLTVPDLVSSGMLPAEPAAFLSLAVESGTSNIGVIGNTGAGKTTFLNALIRFVPRAQRVAVVEEIPEISILHENRISLNAVEHLGIGLDFLVRETLRLRPDRIVVGEVRSEPEAKALRDACLSGPAYSTFFTYHADSPRSACERLKSQGITGNDLGYFGLLVSCRRFETRKGRLERKVLEISEIGEGGEVSEIYSIKNGTLKRTANKSEIERRISGEFLSGKGEFFREISRRAEVLRKSGGIPDSEFFSLWSQKKEGTDGAGNGKSRR